MKVAIWDQQRLLGLEGRWDVRIKFDPNCDLSSYHELVNRCSDLFGEVGPKDRDEDSCMVNDSWGWARSLVRGRYNTSFFNRHSLLMIVLRHRSMLDQLGFPYEHLLEPKQSAPADSRHH
jgi:hypothetical protein